MSSSVELLVAEMHMEQSTSRAAWAYARAARCDGRGAWLRRLALLRLARLHERDAEAWRSKYLCEIRLQEFRHIRHALEDEEPAA